MTFKIRKMQPPDRAAIYDIFQKTGLFSMAMIEYALEMIDIYLFDKEQKEYLVQVAEDDKSVVGFAVYGPKAGTQGTFQLYWIAVAPEMQHQGAGNSLYLMMEEHVRKHNGRLLIIEASSQILEPTAIPFFLANGYQNSGRIKSFFSPNESMVILTKYLHSEKH